MPFGGVELLVILAIILLFFGAKRLPQLGRSLGRSKQEFHKAVVEDSDKGDELREAKDKEELSSSRRGETRAEEGRSRVQHEE
jgi:sec-independent protein translocase protein TatA